jgi:hypothetical protein
MSESGEPTGKVLTAGHWRFEGEVARHINELIEGLHPEPEVPIYVGLTERNDLLIVSVDSTGQYRIKSGPFPDVLRDPTLLEDVPVEDGVFRPGSSGMELCLQLDTIEKRELEVKLLRVSPSDVDLEATFYQGAGAERQAIEYAAHVKPRRP